MKKLTPLQLTIGVFVACTLSARADTINNGFDSGQDYVADGIIGQTMWDGVYLGFGDIPGGDIGGSGAGMTEIASEASPYPSFLNLQSSGGDWSGSANDGFFLYKVVKGDFDVSVASLPYDLAGGLIYDNRGFNFAGLQVRAYNPDNSGAGYSTTDTNSPTAENSIRLWRFQQFNIDGQIRISTNGINQEFTYASNLNTNSPGLNRYYRITRVGNVLSFYYKLNVGDPWIPATNNPFNGTLTRDDWEGVALQVGIAQAPFSTATRDAVFDDFELSGTNVTSPTLPTAPSNLVSTGSDPSGSRTFSWTKGTAGNGSLVVITEDKPIQHNPVNGLTYTASPGFGDSSALIGGDGQYVVYNGTGNSVTVTNLGANNKSYNVAVYEYSGSGDSIVYNTASPATNSFEGPGAITAVELVAPTTEIPVGGAVQLRLIATFSTGETSDQTASAAWVSSDLSVAPVGGASGTVSGLAEGTASITATLGSFSPSVNITVSAFTGFTDDFTTAHDYIADGLPGTPYDGLYLNFGDVPGAVAGGDGEGTTLFMDSQISNTNGLFVSSVQSTWNNTANDGPFLFKIVPGSANGISGDFSATLHIESMNVLNGVVAGLMARLYDPANGGPSPNGLEHHVEFWKVQDGTTSVRRTMDQPGNNTTTFATGTDVNWLLMTRVNSTNFYFFERGEETNAPWTFVTNVVLEAAAGDAPMQVGMAQQSTTGVNGLTTFDYFSLNAAGIVGATTPPAGATDLTITLQSDLSMKLEWVAADAGGNPIPSIAVMRSAAPVSAQPSPGTTPVGDATFGQGTDLGGGNYVVFVSENPPASTNNSVVVSGLTPGETYYAAIYTSAGTGAITTYNTFNVPTAIQVDGVLEDIELSVPGGIPLGGIGKPLVVGIYTGGARLPLTSGVTVTSGDTNVIKIAGGILTGITLGSAPVTAVTDGFTNVASITVRQPTFTDEFNTSRNYLTAGVAGSGYDGVYNPRYPNGGTPTNPVPASPYVPLEGSGAVVADANLTTNGLLTVVGAGDGWENTAAGGFFLFKYVVGDFQTSTRIDSYQIAGYNMPGLLARAYGVDTNSGLVGAPFGTVVTNEFGTNTLGEYFVSLCRFDEFGIGTYARRTIDSGTLQSTQPDEDTSGTNYWLLMVRSGETEFDFYKRSSPTEPWVQIPNRTHYSISQFAGQPMQVGIMAQPWNGTGGISADYRTATFDNFMLDASQPSLEISGDSENVYLSYPQGFGISLQSTIGLNPANWQTTDGTPVATNGVVVTYSVPVTNASTFFRLVK